MTYSFKSLSFSFLFLVISTLVLTSCTSDDQLPIIGAVPYDVGARATTTVGGEAGELQNKLKLKQAGEWSVEYTLATELFEQKTKGAVKLYKKGDVTKIVQQSNGIQAIVMVDGNIEHVCFLTNAWTCYFERYERTLAERFEESLLASPEGFTVVKAESRMLAQTTTSCYVATQGKDSVEYCFTATGVPLYVESKEHRETGGHLITRLQATIYSDTVDSKDIKPPVRKLQDPMLDQNGNPVYK